jgi:hypothetical protein
MRYVIDIGLLYQVWWAKYPMKIVDRSVSAIEYFIFAMKECQKVLHIFFSFYCLQSL